MNGSDPKATFPGAPATGFGAATGNPPPGTGHLAPPGQPTHATHIPGPPLGLSGTNLHQGVTLGKYQIVRQLGAGGMGSVYEAVHTSIGKSVALKTMNPALASDPRAEARFMREAAAASRLGHPNVCDVTDFGSDQGVVYIVMELMRGEDLAGLVAHAPAGLDASFVADVMLAVCAGVYAAHEKGVVHRDLKPQNIFLSRTPLGDVVPKVLDFGISKLLDEEVAGSLTNSGSVMGTTHYLSPEQVTGSPVDGRSDEFALGVILYECLTGQRPHQGDTIFTIMRAISEGRFQRPRALRPDLLPALEAVVLRAMALRADDRYPTVHALGNGILPFATPKGRVLWADYFSRPPATGLSQAMAGTAMQGTLAHQQAHYAGGNATMAMSASASVARPFGGDTRSGVGPVSVRGTGELTQTEGRRRTRGLTFALMGAAAATVGLVYLRPAFLNAPSTANKTTPPAQLQGQEINKPVTSPTPAPTAVRTPPPAPPATPPATATKTTTSAAIASPQPPIATERADDASLTLSRKEKDKEQRALAAKARVAAKAAAAQAAREAKEAKEAKEAAARELAAARKAASAPVTRAPAPVRPKPTPRPAEKPSVPDDDIVDGPRSIASPNRVPILE